MPDEQTIIQLLLQEFRAFRDSEFREFKDDVATWKQDSGARIATLESDVKAGIKGNGQPSRMSIVEEKVSRLERFKWQVTSAGAALWTVVETVIHWRK
jgi:hypothetical protein